MVSAFTSRLSLWRDARVWLIGAASKAVVPQGTGGSNPPLSAIAFKHSVKSNHNPTIIYITPIKIK